MKYIQISGSTQYSFTMLLSTFLLLYYSRTFMSGLKSLLTLFSTFLLLSYSGTFTSGLKSNLTMLFSTFLLRYYSGTFMSAVLRTMALLLFYYANLLHASYRSTVRTHAHELVHGRSVVSSLQH